MKNNKNVFLILSCILNVLMFIVLIALIILFNTNASDKYANKIDGYFDTLDYEANLDNNIPLKYSNTPKVHTTEKAKYFAEEIWTDAYDLETANNNKPYKVYFDFKANIWLVTGSLPKGSSGGVAHLIIKTDGTILAVWQER